MKVCLDMTPLMNSSRFRGIGVYCYQLARALSRLELPAGLELHLLVGGPRWSFSMEPCTPELVARLGETDSDSYMSHNLYYALKHSAAWARLDGSDVDLYHSTEPKGTSRPRGCKTMVTCHDFIPVMSYRRRPWKLPPRGRAAVEWVRFRGLDHAIAISEWTRRDLQQITGFTDEQVTVIHHGVDRDEFSPDAPPQERARVAAAIGTERPYFLYIGGFDHRKQVPALVRAFAARVDDMDQDLVLCGNASKREWRRIRKAMPRGAARARVVCPGYVPGDLLPAIYRQATAHVLASKYEGFGMTMTEAFACGCPVIALSASCIPEIAGDAARLVVDEGHLGQAMVEVATDEAMHAGMRRRGLERAGEFTWERTARETAQVYARVLGVTS